nr:reverse transcriptase domain-containing protein [Tanacetum cinerariifolium]
MSQSPEHAQTPANFMVGNTARKGRKAPTNGPSKLLPNDKLRKICKKHYNQILPIMAEKVHQGKLQGVHTRLTYGEHSHQKEQTREKTPLSESKLRDREKKAKKRRNQSPYTILKKHTSQKAKMSEADIGILNQTNRGPPMRTYPNLGYVRKPIRSLPESATSRRFEGSPKDLPYRSKDRTMGHAHIVPHVQLYVDRVNKGMKYIKDPVKIHHIKQKEGESTEAFMKHFKAKSRHVNGASYCMRISGFMHGITNHDLIKRLNDNILKSIDDMMSMTTAFLRDRRRMVPATTSLLGFSGEISLLLYQISLTVSLGEGERSISTMTNFMVVRSPSPYNGIIGWPSLRKIQAIPYYHPLRTRCSNSSAGQGMFLGHVVNMKGIKACPKKAEAVIKLQSPRMLKEVQSLNGKLASLNKFLSKSVEKSLPFFKTLKNYIKKSDFQWTPEAENAFQDMKQCIAELPMVSEPRPKEELIMYLYADREVVSVVLLRKRDSQQLSVYFVSRALQTPKVNYSSMEKLVLALVHASKAFETTYRPRTSIHGQVLADFIAERPEEDGMPIETHAEEAIPKLQTLFTNGSSCLEGSGAGLILTNPKGIKLAYALRFKFDVSNNEAEYEAPVAGLCIADQMQADSGFSKAFLVIANVPVIYMQEFWATAIVHHHLIRFKMNNKKHIVNLEYFKEMLRICPRILNQSFAELPFEEEIIVFLKALGHSGEIKKITDANINKLHQPWRPFAVVINKCLTGKSTVEHKDAKKSNEMYYPRFTKVIVNFFMTKDPSILRRNKVNSHYVRVDQMFTTIKLVSRHQNTQQYGAILPVELTNEAIRNSDAYKEYYAIASGAEPPKTKASVRKTQSSFDTTMPLPTAACTRLSISAKGKQPAKSSKAKGLYVLSEVALTEVEQMKLATKRSLQQTRISQASGSGADEGTSIIPGVLDVPIYSDDEFHDDQEDEDDQDDDDQDSNNDGDDFVHPKLSTHDEEAKDEESFDPIGDEGPNAEDDDEELYGDLNINLEGRDVQMTDVHTTQVIEDTHVTLTPPMGIKGIAKVARGWFLRCDLSLDCRGGIDSLFESTPRVDSPVTTTIESLLLTAPTLPPPSVPINSQVQQAPAPSPATAPSISPQDLLNFAVQLQSDRLRDEAQVENEDFLNKLDENIQKIIKEQVKVKVFKILPKIEKIVNEQLEAEVLTRESNSSKTSYAMATDPSELELKKILTEKIDSNKSIHRSDEQRNLYKALVDAYECDKIILDIHGDTVTLKKRHYDEDKDEEPSAGSDRGSKRRRTLKEPESTSAIKEKTSKTSGKSTEGIKSQQKTASESAPAEEPMQTTQDLEKSAHLKFETCAADDQPIEEASQHPEWFQKQTKPPTPDLA